MESRKADRSGLHVAGEDLSMSSAQIKAHPQVGAK